MFSRLVRFVTSLAIVGCAYLAYRLVLVPFIEPAPQLRATGLETNWVPAADTTFDRLQTLFAPGSWELDRPKVLETDRGMLLLRDLRELDRFRLELKPCTLILFSGGEEQPGARPVILQAAEGAVLTFDEPINLARGQIGALARGTLPGPVTIRSPESRPGAADQLEVVTHHVQITRDRIEAPQPIRFRYGKSYGSGRDLIIRLTLPAGPSPAGGGLGSKQRLPMVASAELVHVDQIRLQLDNPKEFAPAAETSDKPAAPSLELEITCQGPFQFDFHTHQATFQDRVNVVRVPDAEAIDQLSCERLAVYFTLPSAPEPRAARGGPGKTATSAERPDAVAPDLRGLKVERIQARGEPAVLHAPSYAATLRAEMFEYNFLTREVKIEDRQKLILRYQDHDIEARLLEYRFAAQGRLGRLRAIGPGRAYGTLADHDGRSFEAVWNDRVILQPHQGEHALSLLGGGMLRLYGEGEFAARDLHLWISESRDPRAPPDAPRPRYRYLPLRMLAEGDVRVDSWQLAGTTQRAEVWVRYEDDVEPADSAARDRPAPKERVADKDRPGQKFDVSAEHLQTQLVRRGQETAVEHLILDGRVRLREVRTAKPGDSPMALAGDLVQIEHADTDAAQVVLQGRPAEVSARGATTLGDNIQLHRGENRIWITGPGRMVLPAASRMGPGRERSGTSTAAPGGATAMSVAWNGRMDFDGRTARFQRDVHVRGSERSQQGETFDLLVMGHELNVAFNQEVNLGRDKPPENLDIQELAFLGGVFAQNVGRQRERQTSFDQLQVRDLKIEHGTGRLHALGPGWGSSVRYDQDLGDGGLSSAVGAAAAEPRLAYVRVDYDDEITGNLAVREMTFHGRVRTLYGPVDAWDQTLDPDPAEGMGRGQYLLTSDQLSVADAASRMGSRQAGIELTALGNATIEGDAFSARAWRVAYARAKELVILEGDGRTEAELWRRGSSTPAAAAQQIRFWTTNQSMQVDGGRFLNLGGVGTPLTSPRR